MKYEIIPVTPLQQNCTLLWCEKTRKAAFVDPGGDTERLLAALTQHNVTLEKILLTHAHIDHVGATSELVKHMGVKIEGPHDGDKFWLEALPQQCEMFGFSPLSTFYPDRWLKQGDSVQVGEEILEVKHCPGHTPGHLIFFHAPSKLAWVGDVLFQGSIGRTDFPQGDYNQLIRSIKEQLWALGDDVQFIPGHGPMSTIGEERRNNPFVQD